MIGGLRGHFDWNIKARTRVTDKRNAAWHEIEPRGGGGRDNRGGGRGGRDETPEFADRLVAINRVSKTVKGGKRFGFAALVVVGDQKGRVGFGKGKAKEVPEAIRKATEAAKRGMIRVPLREGRTLHHDMNGRHGAGRVVMRTAPAGTGIIAGGPMRAIFEMLGVQDVVAKSIGSQNPYNMIRATLDGLTLEQSPRSVAQRRGKKVADILPKRDDAPGRRRKSQRRPEPMAKTILVKQIGSPIRRPAKQRATLVGLGLNKMHRTRELEDTPSVRGMVNSIPHLVEIVEERG